MSRDIRTLLFCKTMPDEPTPNSGPEVLDSHPKIYKKLSQTKGWDTYFAFGGYNILCIYPTMENPDASDWLSRINEDKQRIIRSISANVVSHQMHLISTDPTVKEFWKSDGEKYPYFLTTLVYGVKCNNSDSLNDDGSESSKYEHEIRSYLSKKKFSDIRYAVYNGINISDIVILWRASNIETAMELISNIEFEGKARKTLTTISFPMNKEGEIEEYVYKALDESPNQSLQVTIHGSIRDITEFQKFRKLLTKKFPMQDSGEQISAMTNAVSTLNSGKNDFSISERIEQPNLSQLLKLYYKYSNIISVACWELYTELLVEKMLDTNTPVASLPPTDILSNIFKDYRDIYINKRLSKYPWGNPLLEQLNTHYYIDRHPMLHGPSYMIYNTLRIANAYFTGKVPDFSDGPILDQLLIESEPQIIFLTENLDQLTEQITRNDDAMLNNRSSTHTIHFSLPESALDFYHAFLRRIVAFLTVYDENEGRKPDDFEYDFLFIPKTISRFRFSPLFRVKHDWQSEESAYKIWPTKQAYLLEFPLERVFRPMDLFIPMVHECFHCFGDILRRREMRKEHMIYFVATTVATNLNCSDEAYRELVKELAKAIYKDMPKKKAYLDRTARYLTQSAYRMCDLKTLDTVFDALGGNAYYLYTNDRLLKWNDMGQRFFKRDDQYSFTAQRQASMIDTVVKACRYYFKECYADAMTIALLKLTPKEYLNLVKDELRPYYNKMKSRLGTVAREEAENTLTGLAQRFAIVLAACQTNGVFVGCSNAYEAASMEFGNEFTEFLDILEETYSALTNSKKTVSQGSNRFPPAALMQVVDYLGPSIEMLQKKSPVLDLSKNKAVKEDDWAYTIDSLRSDFNRIIRNGEMFGQRFYQITYEHHEDVRADKKNDS